MTVVMAPKTSGIKVATFGIGGMHCAACANRNERSLKKLHGVREAAEAFVTNLWSREAQQGFAKYGLRPVDKTVADEVKSQFPQVEDLWRIDYLGGWKRVTDEIYGPQGIYSKAMEELQRSR